MLALRLFLGRIPSWAWLAIAASAALFIIWRSVDGYGDRRYTEGQTAERTAWERRIAADKAVQAQREAKASATLIQQRQRDQVAADQRTKEISDATQHIPDRAPGERQRVRACLDLLRQGKAPPDCRGVGTR